MEYLRAKNGDLIPLSAFTDSFGAQFLDDVIQFKFIDRGVGKLGLKVVPARDFSEATRKMIEHWLKSFADEVEIDVVDSIPWEEWKTGGEVGRMA